MSTAARKARKKAGVKFQHKKSLETATNWTKTPVEGWWYHRNLIIDGVEWWEIPSFASRSKTLRQAVKPENTDKEGAS